MIRVDRGARYVAVDSMGALRLSTTLVSPPTRHSKRITLCTHCTKYFVSIILLAVLHLHPVFYRRGYWP